LIIKRAISKYGKENFKKEILQICESKKELNFAEKFWIWHYNSMVPIGYNIADGGQGGNLGEIVNKKLRGMQKPQSMKEKTRQRQTGKNNSFYGKKHSKSYLEKMKLCKNGNKNGMYGNGYLLLGNKNGMYKKTVYSIWFEKYGQKIADEKLVQMKIKQKQKRLDRMTAIYGEIITIKKECFQCGKTVTVKEHKLKVKEKYFCSIRCARVYSNACKRVK
jgi:group I intron endonuclease